MHREKSFVPVFFEVCIDRLFDNLGSRKKYIFNIIIVFFFIIFFFRYEPRALLDSRAVSIELKEYVLKS